MRPCRPRSYPCSLLSPIGVTTHLVPSSIDTLRLPCTGQLAQFPLLGELAAQGAEVVDEVATSLDKGGAGGDSAVGLEAEFECTGRWDVSERKERSLRFFGEGGLVHCGDMNNVEGSL